MGQLIWSIIAIVGAFVMCGGVLYCMLTEGDDRQREEAARVYFDEHGHWPDEAPGGSSSPQV